MNKIALQREQAGCSLWSVEGERTRIGCVVLVASGLWFNMCEHLLQAPGCTLVQDGPHSPTREQSQKISRCLRLFLFFRVTDWCVSAGLPGWQAPLLFWSLCCRLGLSGLKTRPYTKTRGQMPSAVSVHANLCMCSLLCIVFLVLFLLYSLSFLSMPQEMLSVGCLLVP